MSKRIPDEEWLHLAKRVAVGSQQRVTHGRERTPAMTVGNTPDRWWAKCMRCNAGAVVKKEHAMIVTREPVKSRDLSLPMDMKPIEQLHPYQQEAIARLLASKGMDRMYLPADLRWSEDRHRLMVPTDRPGQWMGRDTSGQSGQKWLTYNHQNYVCVRHVGYAPAVVTEDLFSAHKVAFATRSDMALNVYCSLGTAIHDSLLNALVGSCMAGDAVMSFYDGDPAGHKGFEGNEKRLRPFSLHTNLPPMLACAPTGRDPKDMSLGDLRRHVEILLRRKDE